MRIQILWIVLATCVVLDSSAGIAENDHAYNMVDKLRVESAEVGPVLFSPNGDDVLDETVIHLTVQALGTDGSSGNGKSASSIEGEIGIDTPGGTSWLFFEEAVPFTKRGNDWVSIPLEILWDGRDSKGFSLGEGDFHLTYTVRKVLVSSSGQRNVKDQVSGELGSVRIDTTPPSISIVQPPNGLLTNQSTIHVAGTARDENGVSSVTVQGAAALLQGEDFSVDLSLPGGEYSLVATATDAAGNSAQSAPVTVFVDLTMPDVAILCPPTGTQTSSAATSIVGNVQDHFGVAFVTVNGTLAALIGNTFHVDQIALIPGNNTFIATATDLAGNTAMSSAVVVQRTEGGPATISTWAGDGTTVFDGDGQPAPQASLSLPLGINADADGILYIGDSSHRRVRRVDASAMISTSAGTGTSGTSGDGGPAANAQFVNTQDVEFGPNESVYILDTSGRKIRKVDSNGIITTVAGTGGGGNGGDEGPATLATFFLPTGIAVSNRGKIYVADMNNERVRVIDEQGIIHHFAGGSINNDGIPASTARLLGPEDVSVTPNGEVLIADRSDSRIRKVDRNGIISTVAGTGAFGFSGDGGSATSAKLWQPCQAIMNADGKILIADGRNHRVRQVNTDGTIDTVAGTGIAGFSGDGGPPKDAKLNFPRRVAFDGLGGFFIADSLNNRVRQVSGGTTGDVFQCTP